MDIGLHLMLQTGPGLCPPILACCSSPRIPHPAPAGGRRGHPL